MTRGPSAPAVTEREPPVVVLLASGSAAAAAALRQAQAVAAGRTGSPAWSVEAAGAPPGPLVRWAWRTWPRPRVRVTCDDTQGWLAFAEERPELLRLIYVRPGLMPARDAVGRPWPPGAAAARWRERVELDGLLRHLPTVAEEQLFGEPARALARMAALLGEAAVPAVAAAPDKAGYGQALRDTLGAGTGAAVAPEWAAAGVLPVRTGGAGLALLGSGWSYPEPDRVWSDGALATLRIAAGAGRTRAGLPTHGRAGGPAGG